MGWDLKFVIRLCLKCLEVLPAARLPIGWFCSPEGDKPTGASGSKGHWLPDCPEYGEIAATKATTMGTLARGRMNSLLWRLDPVRTASRPRVRLNYR
jgi:hypothetical protein